MVAQRFDLDAVCTAEHLQYPVEAVRAALNYYEDYRAEIDQALLDNEIGEERLKRLFPALRVAYVRAGHAESIYSFDKRYDTIPGARRVDPRTA